MKTCIVCREKKAVLSALTEGVPVLCGPCYAVSPRFKNNQLGLLTWVANRSRYFERRRTRLVLSRMEADYSNNPIVLDV